MRRTIALVLIGVGILIVVGSVFALNTNSKTTTELVRGKIERVVVETRNGDVTIRPGDDPEVTRTERWNFSRPRYTQDVSDGTLTVKARCPAAVFNNCSVELALVVPESVDVRTTTRNGDIEISGLDDGSVTVQTANGDVDVTGLASDAVAAATTNGDVTIANVRADSIRAGTTNGEIDVRLAARPDDLRLTSTNGDIEAVLPSGSYDVRTQTNNGDVSVEGLDDDDSSDNTVTATTTNGDIDIRGNSD
jgi:DUF4097 and DUF4098 domain-containing protein YvlB